MGFLKRFFVILGLLSLNVPFVNGGYIGIYNTTTNELIGIIAIEWHKGYPYHDDVIDYFVLKEKAGMIEHLYNQARIDLANTTALDLESRRNKPIL